MTSETAILQALLIAGLWVGSFSDLNDEIIPNALVCFLIIASIVFRFFLNGDQSVLLGLMGIGMGLILYIPLWCLRILGAGDAKFLAAVGACVGAELCFKVGVLALFIGALVSLFVLIKRSQIQLFGKGLIRASSRMISGKGQSQDWLSIGKNKISFAPVISLSVLMILGRWFVDYS